MNNFCVYEHVFPNGYSYVGKTGQKPEERWKEGFGYQNQHKMFEQIVKYGWDNIRHNIIADNLSEKEATDLEKQLIYDRSRKEHVVNTSHVFKGSEISQHNIITLNEDWLDKYSDDISGFSYFYKVIPEARIIEFTLFRLVKEEMQERVGILHYPDEIDYIENLYEWLKRGQTIEWKTTSYKISPKYKKESYGFNTGYKAAGRDKA